VYHRIFSKNSLSTSQILQQRRIAEILSTLDEAIEQTEALIAKMQQVKAGLMHDLFTCVTPDGRLRPTREQAPELYKESPLGWIPKGWDASTLGEACEWFSGGTPSRAKEEWWNGDFPWLTPKGLSRNKYHIWHLIFRPSLTVPQSPNPQRSPATSAVWLNQHSQI
jgi:restriction endonuclease S subunit